MTKEDSRWLQEHLRREANEYLQEMEVTPQERRELRAWVRGGNSAYGNPGYLADENGRELDYITAMRLLTELEAKHALNPYRESTRAELDVEYERNLF